MVRVVYSNRTEELLSELAARVRAQQASDGPLVPVRIVVPSRAIETAVRLGIAREQGIAAHLGVTLLTPFAGELAAPPGARIADAPAIEALALRVLLDDETLAAPDLAPVAAYLRAAGDDPDAIDLRRVQLASRVGRLFEEYTYSRAEMLAAWSGAAAKGGDAHAGPPEVERWQRRLWLTLFGPEGLARRLTPAVVPLHEAIAMPAATRWPADRAWPSVVHVFGFAHVARTFHEFLARAGSATDIVVYTLSPCAGFWEDVDRDDPELLRLWAKPGRENVRALNAAANFDHDDRFVDPLDARPPTMLRRLQSEILHRGPRAPAPPREAIDGAAGGIDGGAPDASVVLLEHASVRRECEAVASAIWQALRDDETLRLDAIAVLVPQVEAAAYVAHLGAAFRESHGIPSQAVGLPEAAPSRVAEAIEMLLALPLGRFTRPEVLRLVVHPSVVASVEGADPDKWIAWCESLGIVHGADHADHGDTYIERDILNWDQGLRRLALGAFMIGDASGDRTPFWVDGHAYLPHEIAGADVHDAAAFGLLVRSLVADARFARTSEMTPREWASFFAAMIETYVAPTSDAEADELARRLRQLGTLGDVDLGGRAIGYRVASELARARLAAGASGRSGEGVVVSTIGAARGIPARVVFACGMGEGRFPTSDAEDPLDLRWARRREGDVTARERDKYAFLEVLLGVRDRLILSYVSRDPLTGDPLSPSSVVQELLHALGARGVDAGPLRRRHPLRRWSPEYFPDLFGVAGAGAGTADHAAPPAIADPDARPIGTMELPEARAEAATLALRRSLERAGDRLAAHDVLARAEGGDPAWTGLAEHLRLAPLPQVTAGGDVRIPVPVHAVVKFLDLPLQGWAEFRLGLDEAETDDVTARETEPFETAARDETLLLRDVLLASAAQGSSLEEAYDAVARERELRGEGPSGVFARGERGDHLRALEEWRAALAAHGVSVESLRLQRFGRGGEHSPVHKVHPAVAIDVGVEDAAGVMRVVRVELAGRTLPVGAGGVSVALMKRGAEGTDEWARAGRRRSVLRAFVDHALLAASGVEANSPHSALVVIATRDRPVLERVDFPPLAPDAAQSWLRGVLGDLLGRSHAAYFPCEAVFVHHARGGGAVLPVLVEARDKLAGDGPPPLRSAYGPVPRPQSYPLPDEATARGAIDRRFAPILAALPAPQENP